MGIIRSGQELLLLDTTDIVVGTIVVGTYKVVGIIRSGQELLVLDTTDIVMGTIVVGTIK